MLKFAPLPHDAAREFLLDKPAVTRDTFDALLPELRARAMVITDVEDLDVVQRVRDRISRVVGDGEDWDKVRKEIAQDVVPWLGDSAEARAKILLRTHGNQVYGLADHEVMERQTEVFPFWQYVSSQDERVRDSHAVLDGIVLPADDPFWIDHYPPWDWNCRCRVVPLMQEDVDAMIEEDKEKPLEERRVLSVGDRERMQSAGKLYRTVKRPGTGRPGVPDDVDVRPPRDRGGSYRFSPAEAKLSVEDLRGRYDADLFGLFESAMQQAEIGDGRTVWQWLRDVEARPENLAQALSGAPIAHQEFTRLVRRERSSRAAKDMRTWNTKSVQRKWANPANNSKKAVRWRKRMENYLAHIQPETNETLTRAWQFDSVEHMERVFGKFDSLGDVWLQDRVAMPTTDIEGRVLSETFLGSREKQGVIWEIRDSQSGRRMDAIFDELGLENEREVLMPQGTQFELLSREPVDVLIDGETRSVLKYVVKEVI